MLQLLLNNNIIGTMSCMDLSGQFSEQNLFTNTVTFVLNPNQPGLNQWQFVSALSVAGLQAWPWLLVALSV